MDTYSIAKAWQQALAADADLDAFVQATFGKGLSYFLGLDWRDLPGAKHAPYIVLDPSASRTGEIRDHEFKIGLVIGIGDKELEKVGALTEWRGYRILWTELMPRVLAIVEDAVDLEQLGPVEASADMPDHGFFELEMIITAKTPYVIRGG